MAAKLSSGASNVNIDWAVGGTVGEMMEDRRYEAFRTVFDVNPDAILEENIDGVWEPVDENREVFGDSRFRFIVEGGTKGFVVS